MTGLKSGAVWVPLLIAVILVAEVAPAIHRGPFGMTRIIALMVAGVCLGVAYAAWQARR